MAFEGTTDLDEGFVVAGVLEGEGIGALEAEKQVRPFFYTPNSVTLNYYLHVLIAAAEIWVKAKKNVSYEYYYIKF